MSQIPSLFSVLNSKTIAARVAGAKERVIYIAPGIWRPVALQLADRFENGKLREVVVSLDFNEKVLRLGYGELRAVEILLAAAIEVRDSPGLRTAFLIVDEAGWVFTPTPHLLEDEPQSVETPNALRLTPDQIQTVLLRVSPLARDAAVTKEPAVVLPEQEIGLVVLSDAQVQQVKSAIELAPPVPFDVIKQVLVFQPYLQYVDVELTGASIEKHTVTIPPSIQNMGLGPDLKGRLRTTFALLAKDDELSSKSLRRELDTVRKDLTRSLPKFGRVILKNSRPRFDERIAQLRERVVEHATKVEKKLAAGLAASRSEIIKYYLPKVAKNPPDELYNSVLTGKPGLKEVRQWLEGQLDKVFPTAEELIGKMELFVDYKDVTFETLNQPDFFTYLTQAYPNISWDKPFSDFKAAGEKQRD